MKLILIKQKKDTTQNEFYSYTVLLPLCQAQTITLEYNTSLTIKRSDKQNDATKIEKCFPVVLDEEGIIRLLDMTDQYGIASNTFLDDEFNGTVAVMQGN